jgi:hypothetical protein
MSNIINFNKDTEEQCECSLCQLANEFLEYAVEAESKDELFNVLREMVSEAYKQGMLEVLQQQIQANVELIDDLLYGEDEIEN